MKTNVFTSTRVGLSLALLSLLAIFAAVAIQSQAANAAGDASMAAGCYSMNSSMAMGASCHKAAAPAKEDGVAATPAAEGHAHHMAAESSGMMGCGMHGMSNHSAPESSHHH